MSIIEFKTGVANLEGAFRLLSACYYQPCPVWSEEQLMPNLVRICGEISPQAATAAKKMSDAWSQSDPEELTVEYSRLFVGPHVLLAPPYGSVYLEPGKQVMGESTLAVTQFYRESGLSMDADFTEMPDHIAVELEFLSYLLQRAAAGDGQEGIKQWLDQAGIFRERFLVRWCGQFCSVLRANTDNPFYKSLADVTEQLVSSPLPELAV